jgi:ParB family chromosome partitioning protein
VPLREDPIQLLFPPDDMRANGYDKSQPIVIDGELKYVVDGHTRLAAARMAGLVEIPVVEKSFETKENAVLYCYQRQLARRNLTPAEILMAVKRLEGRRSKHGAGDAAEDLAGELGISRATVNRAKKVLAEAPEEKIEAIKKGDKTITGVFNEITKPEPKAKVKPEMETFNKRAAENESEYGINEILAEIEAALTLVNGSDFDDAARREVTRLLAHVEEYVAGIVSN